MWVSALVLGLLGSFHCIGMCGPIAFMLPVDRENSVRKAGQVFVYHFGRIFSYALLGLLFGWIGKGLYLFGMQQWLSVVIGILMIVVVLLPKRIWNRINASKPISKLLFNCHNKQTTTSKGLSSAQQYNLSQAQIFVKRFLRVKFRHQLQLQTGKGD